MTVPDLAAFAAVLPDEGKVVLCTHRNPDPDGLGALLGLQFLLREKYGLDSDLVLEGRIRRAENVSMRRLLEINSVPKGGIDPSCYAGVMVVDSQPGFSHTHPPGALEVLVVIDHHESDDESRDRLEDSFCWVDSSYGSTSTMVFDLLKAAGVTPDERTATGMFCGVRYDTNDLARDADERDIEAYTTLQQLADRKMVAEIDNPELSRAYFAQMAEAIDCCVCHGPLLLTLMGNVASPETVAEVADWFVRLEGKQWSLAGGACDGLYQLSVRTDMPGADAYPALRYIIGSEGAGGGHGRMAGGQISLSDLSLEEVIAIVRRRALEVFGESDSEGMPLVVRPDSNQAACQDAVD